MQGLFKALAFSLLLTFALPALAQDMAPIDVNTADAELLQELPGIGETRAQAIVEEREANGPFESADDMTRVSGIGATTIDGFRDQVSF
ncbi:competence protein ComEA [Franzmannia pantelleriensis]|uniref:Competence protein ComEA n=1 Tax=Franzmannia pantelleriensis TaxID=48727 RepID=A0A1G9M1D6_9GAMM|nr:ComEA family DNA-binding protein [Halomonas pantelleriensis]SDL67737.1 competence protein ComEA [Halomonas pantelleriensis]